MSINLTAAKYTKHFDVMLHLQSSKEEDIRAHARAIRSAEVVACCANSFWIPVVAEELRGSDVRVGTVISFPHGCTSAGMKFAGIERGLRLGATAVDMVVNIGRLREGDDKPTRCEMEGPVERMRGTALSRVIFGVCFLTGEEIARPTRTCSDAGIDHVKTAMGSQGLLTKVQVQVMRDNITNDSTKLEVSRVLRIFTMPAILWMIEQLDVSLIGTRSAASLVQQYAARLSIN